MSGPSGPDSLRGRAVATSFQSVDHTVDVGARAVLTQLGLGLDAEAYQPGEM